MMVVMDGGTMMRKLSQLGREKLVDMLVFGCHFNNTWNPRYLKYNKPGAAIKTLPPQTRKEIQQLTSKDFCPRDSHFRGKDE